MKNARTNISNVDSIAHEVSLNGLTSRKMMRIRFTSSLNGAAMNLRFAVFNITRGTILPWGCSGSPAPYQDTFMWILIVCRLYCNPLKHPASVYLFLVCDRQRTTEEENRRDYSCCCYLTSQHARILVKHIINTLSSSRTVIRHCK